MQAFDWTLLDAAQRRQALARPRRRADPALRETVSRIFDEIEAGGEAALNAWAVRLDGHRVAAVELDPARVKAARAMLEAEDLAAIELAAANIEAFHQATRPVDGPSVEPCPGARLTRVWRPIQAAGLYVPGGTAPLLSTLLMLAIPARVAGVPLRVAVTPPGRDGSLAPAVIAAAAVAGLERIFTVGGAQAIAALTFGVGPVPLVDKVFGPGNAWVAEAKRQAAERSGGPAYDLPAGPSELMVIADDGADPARVAADLLSQAEHDADAQVILVTIGEGLGQAVLAELARQTPALPRAELASAALAGSRLIAVADPLQAAEVANLYAPEHLSIQTREARALVDRIQRAGTVFVGPYAAETFGDYLSGSNHVLPTDGAARAHSGLSTAAFMTAFTVQEQTAEAAALLAGPAARLARLEGLEAHARAADIRAGQAA